MIDFISKRDLAIGLIGIAIGIMIGSLSLIKFLNYHCNNKVKDVNTKYKEKHKDAEERYKKKIDSLRDQDQKTLKDLDDRYKETVKDLNNCRATITKLNNIYQKEAKDLRDQCQRDCGIIMDVWFGSYMVEPWYSKARQSFIRYMPELLTTLRPCEKDNEMSYKSLMYLTARAIREKAAEQHQQSISID